MLQPLSAGRFFSRTNSSAISRILLPAFRIAYPARNQKNDRAPFRVDSQHAGHLPVNGNRRNIFSIDLGL